MKRFVLLLLCAISVCSYSQMNEQLITKQEIDEKTEKARKISTENPQRSIDLSIESYTDSKKIKYKEGMLESNVIGMSNLYDTGNPKKVIELSAESEKLGKELGDMEALCNIYRLKGQAYDQLAFFEKSINELNKSLITNNKIKSSNSRSYNLALIYMGIASVKAHINDPIDSVIYYQKKTLEAALEIDENIEYQNKKYYLLAMSYINLAMTSAALNNFQESEDYLTKALNICKNKKYIVGKRTEILVLNEFAWLYYAQKNYKKAIEFAIQGEELERKISLPYIRRDIYEVLFKSYIETGDKAASTKYTRLFGSLNDSIVNAEKLATSTHVKHIIKEQNDVNKTNLKKIYLTIIIAIIIIFITIWFFRKKKKFNERNHTTLEKLNENKNKESSTSEKSIVIADETVAELLLKLKKFEDSQKYLRQDVNLTYLANSLNTNTRYLSEVIHQYRGKNFYNYLNGLRIEYITALLREEPKYRSYKISYLAEICGFTSREVFSTIFKKETGVTPSYFINNLREEKSEI